MRTTSRRPTNTLNKHSRSGEKGATEGKDLLHRILRLWLSLRQSLSSASYDVSCHVLNNRKKSTRRLLAVTSQFARFTFRYVQSSCLYQEYYLLLSVVTDIDSVQSSVIIFKYGDVSLRTWWLRASTRVLWWSVIVCCFFSWWTADLVSAAEGTLGGPCSLAKRKCFSRLRRWHEGGSFGRNGPRNSRIWYYVASRTTRTML